jgi:PhnB protein
MYNPDGGFPRVVPELVYQDVAAAVDWLSAVFGFREILRHPLGDGQVDHADMDTGSGGVIMLTSAEGGRRSPADDEHVCKKVIVFVDDVDRHFAASVRAGAETLHAPLEKPWGLRQYIVKDREGHLWEFSQHMRDVPAGDWGAVTTAELTTAEHGGAP